MPHTEGLCLYQRNKIGEYVIREANANANYRCVGYVRNNT